MTRRPDACEPAPFIGVISDTHGLLRPEASAALAGAELILHAGDIGDPSVIIGLEAIAPVFAIRGNVDRGDWARAFPETRCVDVLGVRIYMLHDLNLLTGGPPDGVQAVVCGHSHKPAIRTQAQMLFFNPGSAGRRRFRLPVSVGKLHLKDGELTPEIIELAP